MPGPQDQGDQLELARVGTQDGARGADSPRSGDRPARGSAEDLGQRLERLPHGHPSSPYHDDGAPKQPLVRLKNLELPLPGEEREPHGGASRDMAVLRTTMWPARDGAAAAAADAGPGGDQATVVQDGQPVVRPPEPAPEGREPPRRDPGAREQSGQETTWEQRSAQEVTQGRSSTAEDQPAKQEHEPEDHDVQLAPAHEADLDDEPTTQDQPAIADDQAPAAVEDPRAGPADRLTPEQVRIAVRALGQCRLAEGRSVFGSYGETGLTPAMRRIEDQLDHGELVPETEKYALKSLDRFQEKLAKLIADEPGSSPDDLANGIHDGIRYTFIFDADNYTGGVRYTRVKLEEHGYSLELLRNTWDQDQYKGINSRWHDPASEKQFEVQFHTYDSWEAKQRTHDAYERIDSLATPTKEKERLKAYQREVTATIPIPAGCLSIADYRKEG